MVVPSALRVLRLKPQRPFTDLGRYVARFLRQMLIVFVRLSSEVGWKYGNTITALEAKRKVKAQAWYERQRKLDSFKRQAVAQSQDALKKQNAILQPLRA